MQARLAVLILVLFSFLHSNVALAQWQPDGAALCTAVSNQLGPTIVSDGAGGAIVTWADYRNSLHYDVYAQRISVSGAVQWTADGAALCTTTGQQFAPAIASDGAGGAIVVWQDTRGAANDIYAQRINASGVAQWTSNGVALCSAANDQLNPRIVADGAGGAIVTWEDNRSGTSYDIYVQRINASGLAQWTSNGVVLCNLTSQQTVPALVSDGAGSAIVVWQDYRSGAIYDLYMQRVNAAGATMWSPNGAALCTATGDQMAPAVLADGAGGAFVTWYDFRTTAPNIYAQRVNISGAAQWNANGNVVCYASGEQYFPTIASDGAGGAIIAWFDRRSAVDDDIYAQRVNAAGGTLWTTDGVALCTASGEQMFPALVADSEGGAIVTWQDVRNTTDDNTYAQRINAWGAVQWTANGVALCTASGDEHYAKIISDGMGGAIVTWQDYRSGSADVYAQRVDARYGAWGRPEPMVTSVADIRNDQGGKVKVNWTASGRDVLNQQTITHYSIWRGSDAAAASAMKASALVTDPSQVMGDFSGKALWKQRAGATDYYWEWVGNQDAIYQKAYTFSASTRADSSANGPATAHFMVVSHTVNQFTFWPSNEMSGHSVDNLAPDAPLYLTALRAGSNVYLRWNRVHVPDLRDYAVYRATSSGVTPVPVNFLSSADDTMLVDANAPPSSLYYIVTAYDVHANQSLPSNEAVLQPGTGVGDLPPITSLMVLQNRPNPFSTRATFELGLPAAAQVNVAVYDVAGRRVKAQSLGLRAAGWQTVTLEATDEAGHALASGVYFYRITASGTTITRKMVIAR